MANITTKTLMITRSMARNNSSSVCKVPIVKMQKNVDDNANIDKDKLQVIEYPDKNMFIMKMGSYEGNVEYVLKDNTYDLIFSNIPENLQGHGFGKILAQVRNFCSFGVPAVIQLDLVDDINNNQFAIKLNGDSAIIVYELKDNVYRLIETKVPENFRSRGIGKIIAQKTFDLIAEKNMKMKLTCEFLEYFYKRNEKRYSKYVV